MVISFSERLELSDAIEFCNNLWNLEDSDIYEFDFSNLKFTEPFTLAYVSIEMKRFRDSKKNKRFTASNFEHLSYQSHMGFFRSFGVKYGKEPGQALGSSTYIPITILKIEDLKNEAYEIGLEIGDLLEEKAKNISEVLTQQINTNLTDTLTFSIREILRNVVEHSDSEILEYCAQYWSSNNLVEVAIFDTGKGIYSSLKSNPYLKIDNDRDAVQMSLMPSISGKMFKGIKQNKNNPWQNSGYGLYMTNRICRHGSDFFIVSNDSGLLFNDNSKTDYTCTYKGTALRLRINTNNLQKCSDMLKKFREEGKIIANRYNDDDLIEPSIASTMLTRDFH